MLKIPTLFSPIELQRFFNLNDAAFQRLRAFKTIEFDGNNQISKTAAGDCLPAMGALPEGLPRGETWFCNIPQGRAAIDRVLKDETQNQKLSTGEIAARTNDRTISIEVSLELTPELIEATTKPIESGLSSRFGRSLKGQKSAIPTKQRRNQEKNWQADSIRSAYIAERLIKLAANQTGQQFRNLFSSPDRFEMVKANAINEFRNGSTGYAESVSIPGRFSSVLVKYSLSNSLLFPASEVNQISSQIF